MPGAKPVFGRVGWYDEFCLWAFVIGWWTTLFALAAFPLAIFERLPLVWCLVERFDIGPYSDFPAK